MMASNELIIKFEDDFKKQVEQSIRDIVILEIGEVWEQYCFENNISPEIKLGFLDYLNKHVDEIIK